MARYDCEDAIQRLPLEWLAREVKSIRITALGGEFLAAAAVVLVAGSVDGAASAPAPAKEEGARAETSTAATRETDVLVPDERHLWVAPLFVAIALGLVPWTLYLAVTLPSRHIQKSYYDVAWAGFDLALAAAIVATGVGILRRRLWVQSVAACAATLLICDAWFDVLSSSPGPDRMEALALALLAELPMAVFCVYIARNSEQVAARAHRYALTARGAGRRRRRVADR